MIEESFFRIISLAILMVVIGGGWYMIKFNKVKNKEENEKKIKKQAKKEGIRYSVILGVVYMVIILGISGI